MGLENYTYLTIMELISTMLEFSNCYIRVAQFVSDSNVRLLTLVPEPWSNKIKFIDNRPITDVDYAIFQIPEQAMIYQGSIDIQEILYEYRRAKNY